MPDSVTDTIYALSSGSGKAGVAVVRVSGPAGGPWRCKFHADVCRNRASRRARFGACISQGTLKLDEAQSRLVVSSVLAVLPEKMLPSFTCMAALGVIRMFLAELGSLDELSAGRAGRVHQAGTGERQD